MKQSAQGTVHVIAGAAWTQGAASMTKVPRFTGKVLDQSLGGYRMAWASAEQARARVGELVGLNFGDEGEEQAWMVGVMRWLRYEDDGSLSAGVELLSRRSSAVRRNRPASASSMICAFVSIASTSASRLSHSVVRRSISVVWASSCFSVCSINLFQSSI